MNDGKWMMENEEAIQNDERQISMIQDAGFSEKENG